MEDMSRDFIAGLLAETETPEPASKAILPQVKKVWPANPCPFANGRACFLKRMKSAGGLSEPSQICDFAEAPLARVELNKCPEMLSDKWFNCETCLHSFEGICALTGEKTPGYCNRYYHDSFINSGEAAFAPMDKLCNYYAESAQKLKRRVLSILNQKDAMKVWKAMLSKVE